MTNASFISYEQQLLLLKRLWLLTIFFRRLAVGGCFVSFCAHNVHGLPSRIKFMHLTMPLSQSTNNWNEIFNMPARIWCTVDRIMKREIASIAGKSLHRCHKCTTHTHDGGEKKQ